MKKIILAGSHEYTYEVYKSIEKIDNVVIKGILENSKQPKKIEIDNNNKSINFQVHEKFKDIPKLTTKDIKDGDADILLSVFYNQIFKPDFLTKFKLGSWNIHPGILPKYRGRNIYYWTIINQEKEQGLTFHELDSNIDSGRILDMVVYPVDSDDLPQDLYDKGIRVVGNFASKCIERIMNNNYDLIENDISKGEIYSTESVDYSNLNFELADFKNFDEAQKILRALTFPRLNQHPSITHNGETLIIKSKLNLKELKKFFI